MPIKRKPESVTPSLLKKAGQWLDEPESVVDSWWEKPVKAVGKLGRALLPSGEPEDFINPLMTGPAAIGGLAYKAYKDKLPHGKLFHGSPKPWDKIDESKLSSASAFGKGLYAGEKPSLAEKFRTMHLNDSGMIMPLESDAQNILDLVEPDPADVHKIMRLVPEGNRETLMQFFNESIQKGVPKDQAYKKLASMLGAPEGTLTQAGFDGVRYPYDGEVAWMFPNTTPLTSAYGKAPLNEAAEKLRKK